MNETSVTLKTIATLKTENAKFYIDSYQRGYRWSSNEVISLLNDIREFSKTNPLDNDGTFYCLQPIIVTKTEDGSKWKVIDGQQRLTALFLIFSFYFIRLNSQSNEKLPFDIEYRNKPQLQECIHSFVETSCLKSDYVNEHMTKYENDIDCYYVLESYKCICDYFSKLSADPHSEDDMFSMRKIFNTRMRVIWYEIENSDVSTEVNVFTRINMGRIPLTNAELIKALLLAKDNQNRLNKDNNIASIQTNIAVRWDEIEAQLSDDDFWSFLVNDEEEDYSYATRIDFIFRLMARALNEGILKRAENEFRNEEPYTVSELNNNVMFPFYVFSNYMRLLNKHSDFDEDFNKEINVVEYIWNNVSEYFRMFKDWYKNYRWYHMIGFLVQTSEKKYIEEILQLTKIYRQKSLENGFGHKENFEKKLKQLIVEKLLNSSELTKSELRDFIVGINYKDTQSNIIRNTLLLYNIAYLDLCKENGRFPFSKYKKEKMWDIEHINAISEQRPDDDSHDISDNPRLLWLQRALTIPNLDDIKLNDEVPIKEKIDRIIEKKLYLEKNQSNTKDFVNVYDAVINYFDDSGNDVHDIGNLTILDGGTNRSYQNDVFPLKRKTILDKTLKDVFIPLCTKKVFMKGFIESTDLLRWGKEDRDAYVNDIIRCISEYLSLQE